MFPSPNTFRKSKTSRPIIIKQSPIIPPPVVLGLDRRIRLWGIRIRLLHGTGADTAVLGSVRSLLLRRFAKTVPEILALGFDVSSVRGRRAGFLVLALDEAVERLGGALCAGL